MLAIVNRAFFGACLCLCGSLAHADWLIDTPTARKIAFKRARYEFRSMLKGGMQEHRLGYGLTETVELTFRSERLASGLPTVGTADLSYVPTGPVPGLSPGIVFGIMDIADKTRDGRRGFLGMTFREDFTGLDGTNYGDITLGAFVGKVTQPFFGASVPFSGQFRLLVEHNGLRPVVGLELRPFKELSLRYILRDRETLFGISLAYRF